MYNICIYYERTDKPPRGPLRPEHLFNMDVIIIINFITIAVSQPFSYGQSG